MSDGPDLTLLAALVAAQDYATASLSAQAASIAAQAVATYEAWYAADEVATWSAQLAEDVGSVLQVLAGLTDAYMATIISVLTNTEMRPVGEVETLTLREGITPSEAYQRSAAAYRYQQSRLDGATAALATADNPTIPRLRLPVTIAANRAVATANRDAQLTVQQQSAKTMSAAADRGLVIGWRRMVHPELSRTGTCGLCIAASTRIYKTGELMPIHDRCHCLPMPITETSDPGLHLDAHAFGQLYGEAGSTAAAELKKTRYMITHNGELGPVLAPAGARQRTPRVVAAATKDRPPMSPAAKDRHLTELRDSLTRSLPRIDEMAAADTSGRWSDYRNTVTDRIHQLDSSTAA